MFRQGVGDFVDEERAFILLFVPLHRCPCLWTSQLIYNSNFSYKNISFLCTNPLQWINNLITLQAVVYPTRKQCKSPKQHANGYSAQNNIFRARVKTSLVSMLWEKNSVWTQTWFDYNYFLPHNLGEVWWRKCKHGE